MSNNIDRGKEGEDQAVTYLQKNGYKILERNWRFGKLEIDIVAESESHIVITEVKTRRADTFGAPEEFVNLKKQKHLITAANRYIEAHPSEKEIRFDIIGITLYPKFNLVHISEAFYP